MDAIEFTGLFNNSGVESSIVVPVFRNINPTAEGNCCIGDCDCDCVVTNCDCKDCGNCGNCTY